MRVLCLFDTGIDRGECHQLIGLRALGAEPVVVCRPGTARIAELEAAGIEVLPIKIGGKVRPSVIRALRRLVRTRRFDLVHAFRKRALSNYRIATIGLGAPPIIAYRGIIGNLSYWDPFAWLTFLDPRLARIVCVCDAVQDYFLEKRLLGFFSLFDRHRVRRIYKGHRVEWYDRPPADPPLRARFGIPADAPVIGCVSRVKARKGIRELIEAMARIKARQDVHLVIFGRVEDRRHVRSLARSPCRGRIHLVGFHEDAVGLVQDFDIITLPSLRREGLPRAVIEGMAQAVPPVVTEAGGSPELVEPGVSGLVVPPGDIDALAAAFDRLLSDDRMRCAMGQAARARIARDFGVDATIAQTWALYQEVIGASLKVAEKLDQ
ncbi:MAG: glycosyltransferase family 4 protein [Halothiobacillaceae bacterium]